jgi:hypothetical protein
MKIITFDVVKEIENTDNIKIFVPQFTNQFLRYDTIGGNK